MPKWIPITVLVALLLGAAVVSGRADGDEPAGPEEAVRRLLPEGWTAAPEAFANAERLLPGARSWFCRLPARGGYPYERIVLSEAGEVLSRTDARKFLDRVRAPVLEARRETGGWVSSDRGAVDPRLLDALSGGHPARDAGGALTAAVLLLDLLTYEGRFRAATVSASGTKGFDVDVDWAQGNPTWSFEESARWTFRFDPEGTLSSLRKKQTSYEEHLRK